MTSAVTHGRCVPTVRALLERQSIHSLSPQPSAIIWGGGWSIYKAFRSYAQELDDWNTSWDIYCLERIENFWELQCNSVWVTATYDMKFPSTQIHSTHKCRGSSKSLIWLPRHSYNCHVIHKIAISVVLFAMSVSNLPYQLAVICHIRK
jgi:hypothetical protein